MNDSTRDDGGPAFPRAKTIDGWWFSAGKTLPHGDGRRIQIGRTHKKPLDRETGRPGSIVPCRCGFHVSQKPLDALDYAPGPIVWKVRGSGIIVPHGHDKHACSERTYIAGGIDVSDTLRAFARKCALDVIDLWTAPEIVVRYLKTGDEGIRAAAWDAACAAANADADAAARAAARAACAAARAAADAARATARDAAADAAWAAAWAAWDAAWAAACAARDAAWAAAWDKENRRLTAMLNAVIEKASKETS